MFRTFLPKKKSLFSISSLVSVLVFLNGIGILAMYIVALFPQMFRYKDRIMEATIPVIYLFLALSLLRVLLYIFYHSTAKKEIGTLQFFPNEIRVNSTTYPIDEITSIRIIGNDIKGDFRGYISKGIENTILLTLKNGDRIETNFEQKKDNRLSQQKEILAGYRNAGLLSEANFYNLCNNTNYY